MHISYTRRRNRIANVFIELLHIYRTASNYGHLELETFLAFNILTNSILNGQTCVLLTQLKQTF